MKKRTCLEDYLPEILYKSMYVTTKVSGTGRIWGRIIYGFIFPDSAKQILNVVLLHLRPLECESAEPWLEQIQVAQGLLAKQQ